MQYDTICGYNDNNNNNNDNNNVDNTVNYYAHVDRW